MPLVSATPAYTLDTPTSIFYVGVLFVLCFFFIMCLLGIGLLPSQDPTGEDGQIMDINYLKYAKYPLGALAWGLLVIISFVIFNFAEGYLTEGLLLSIFKMFFTILMTSATIAIPVIFWFGIAKFMHDQVIKRMIQKNIMGEI